MATLNRTLLTSGAALITASAIVAAPVMAPGAGVLMGAPAPAALSSAQYELTALSDITLQGINDAIVNGFGGNLGPTDPYYPGVFDNTTKVTGIYGAAYYVLDQSGVVPFKLDQYFFEAGSTASNPLTGGLGAVAYVGLTSVLGVNSLPAQLAKAVFVTGAMNIQDAVLALTAGIPVLNELASVYVNGAVAGGTNYGTGLAGVAAYIQATYPGIASLVGSIDFGKLGVGGKSDSEDDESDSDSEDSEDDHSSSGSQSDSSNDNGSGRRDDRVASPAAAIAVSLPRPAAAASQVASVPALASVSSTARSVAAAVVSPKRASARGASAASVARPNAGAVRSARAAAAAR